MKLRYVYGVVVAAALLICGHYDAVAHPTPTESFPTPISRWIYFIVGAYAAVVIALGDAMRLRYTLLLLCVGFIALFVQDYRDNPRLFFQQLSSIGIVYLAVFGLLGLQLLFSKLASRR